jgi:hypothetical protein
MKKNPKNLPPKNSKATTIIAQVVQWILQADETFKKHQTFCQQHYTPTPTLLSLTFIPPTWHNVQQKLWKTQGPATFLKAPPSHYLPPINHSCIGYHLTGSTLESLAEENELNLVVQRQHTSTSNTSENVSTSTLEK